MRRRMEEWYLVNRLQPQFPTEVRGNPSNSVDVELHVEVFPSSVAHLRGIPSGQVHEKTLLVSR